MTPGVWGPFTTNPYLHPQLRLIALDWLYQRHFCFLPSHLEQPRIYWKTSPSSIYIEPLSQTGVIKFHFVYFCLVSLGSCSQVCVLISSLALMRFTTGLCLHSHQVLIIFLSFCCLELLKVIRKSHWRCSSAAGRGKTWQRGLTLTFIDKFICQQFIWAQRCLILPVKTHDLAYDMLI